MPNIQKVIFVLFFSAFLFGCKTETREVEKVVTVEKIVEVEKKLPQVTFQLTGMDTLPVTMSYQEVLINEEKPTRLNLSSLRVTYTPITDGKIEEQTRKEILQLENSSYTLEFPKEGTYAVSFSGSIQSITNSNEGLNFEYYQVESSFLIHTDTKERNINLQLSDWWENSESVVVERTPNMYDYLSHSGETCYISENASMYDAFRVKSNELQYVNLLITCSEPAVLRSFQFVSEDEKAEISYYEDGNFYTFPSQAVVYKDFQLNSGINYVLFYLRDTSAFRIQNLTYEIDQQQKENLGHFDRKYDEVEKGSFILLSKAPNKTTFASAYESAKVDEVCLESSNVLNSISLNGKTLHLSYQLEGLQCFKVDERVNTPSLWLLNNHTSAWNNETITLESPHPFTLKRVTGMGLASQKEIETKF